MAPNTPPPISIQLYTLREEASTDFRGTIERLGRIGFVGVEPAALHDLSAEEFRRCVKDAQMVVSSGHGPVPAGDTVNAILDQQQTIGCDEHVVAFLPPDRFKGSDAVRATADELNEAHENVKPRGMRMGYHNHNWEFSQQVDGRSAHALLFEHLEPEIFAELDIYWAQVGGADPARVVADLGSRARLLHVKDGPADDPKSDMTAVGRGAVDIQAVVGAADAAWHIVELDRCATDMFEAVEESYRYLVGEGLSRGRS